MRQSAIATLEPIAAPESSTAAFTVVPQERLHESHQHSYDLDASTVSLTFESASKAATNRTSSAAARARQSEAQLAWAATPLAGRLRVIRRTRALLAERTELLTAAISPTLARNPADTLVAEVLPLLAACRFLEREAASILCPRRLGRRGRPFWLPGVTHLVERVPLGRVLVIAPGNYPLLLAGVQVLQALVAGNAVTWKPGSGGEPIARLLALILTEAGLPKDLLTVTGESAADAEHAIARGVDKIFLTGSAATGRAVLAQAAKMLTPCVVELSGCDSVVVLPDVDLARVVKALSFGMCLNGSATCMAPRRVLLVDFSPDRRTALIGSLLTALDRVPGVRLPLPTRQLLDEILADAIDGGATIHGKIDEKQKPILITDAPRSLRAAQTDIFAPLLTVIDVADDAAVLATEAASAFALTCAIFGEERRARSLAARLGCGTVSINDLIVPTADPRVPFGGRRDSGFGVSRGAEGLLEMTAVRVISTRRGRGTRHYDPTTNQHESLFRALARSGYAEGLQRRWQGARELIRAARGLGERH